MSKSIEIVDRGRGPQLSSSRITVQDVVPYLQRQCTHEQIREIMPSLTVEEIEVIEEYVRQHHAEVMEQDRRIRERAAARQKPARIEETERRDRVQRLEEARRHIGRGKEEPNGDRPPG